MSGDRLTGSEKRGLLLWIVLGVFGAWFAHRYFFRAFPEASVDFKVSRNEALVRAQSFVSGLGENISNYQSSIIFDVDDNAKTYLEREVGLQEANRLMSSELNIWYWEVRFFRPQQEEEFRVRVSPGGEIVGYEHKVEEKRTGATSERKAAQARAEDFLLREAREDLSRWDFLPEEANSEKKPNRVDWSFTWERHGFRAKEAPYRLRVKLQGDQPSSSEEFLQVPEAWERSYQQLRSKNNFYGAVAIIPYFLLIGTAIWAGIQLWRQGKTTWLGAIKLGAIVAIALTFMQLNQWPLARASYNTNGPYSAFAFEEIAKALLFGVFSALTITLILPGSEPLYRAAHPSRLRLAKAFTLRGLRSKEFFSSATVGLSMAAAHIGFVVAFYIVAGKFGAWAPQDLNYENSVNTAFPWISGVAIGLLASTSEEFLFRLFAIPFLHRITRSRVLAVIVPAFCWSFLHSSYPNEPPYIRGIEVGLIGIVAGIVMLRWGILATLIWHYTVDASLVGLFLLRSNSLYFKITGIVVGAAAVAPLAFAGVSYLLRGRFEEDEDLLNGAEPTGEISFTTVRAEGEASRATAGKYEALAPGMLMFLAVCLVFGGLAAFLFKTPAVGDYLKLSVDGRTAVSGANDILRRRGIDPNSYHRATVLVDVTDPITNEFLRERIGIPGLNEIYAKQVPGALWRVRYFRDGQPEEYGVILKPDGSLHSVHHILAEAATGASLTKEQAIAQAQKYLLEEKKADLAGWSLVDSDSTKRPHRTDHTLTWQQKTALDDLQATDRDAASHAYARIELQVLGDEPANYRTYIKIPDEWRREATEKTILRTIYGWSVPVLLFGGFGVACLVFFLMDLRSEAARSVGWRRVAKWSLAGLGAYTLIFSFGAGVPLFMNRYDTAIPLKVMYGILGIGAIFGAAFTAGAIVLLFGLAWYYGYRAFGEGSLPVGPTLPAAYYRDALWIGMAGASGLLGLERLLAALAQHWPTVHRSIPASFGQNFDAIVPASFAAGDALRSGLFLAGSVALISGFVSAVLRPRWLRFLLFSLAVLFGTGSDWGSSADFAKQFVATAILLGVIVFSVRRIVRFNLLGYFLVVACATLIGTAAKMLAQPNSYYRTNGYAVLLMLILLLAWPFAAWRMRTASGG